MSDLIIREDALEIVKRTGGDYATAFSEISKLPAVDAVDVVRCRYCKHFTEGMAVGMCKRNPDKPIIPVPYNHFCSYGERREENEVD